MFIVWALLAGLYAFNFVQLFAQGEPGGALVVGAIAAIFALLSWRSYHKRRARHQEKRL